MHLASLVDDFRAHGTETAVVSHRGVRRYATSYADLAWLAGRFAAGLEDREVRPGERVVLWGENGAAWMAAFFGCLIHGALIVPLDAAGSPEFAERIVAEVDPKLIVGDAGLLRVLGGDVPTLAFSEMAEALPGRAKFEADASVEENAPFQIVFTSGTTSDPKGIVHTHRNVLASLRPIEAEILKYRKYERWVHPLRFLHTLPLSHVFGQFMGLWVPGLLGAEVHFAERLDPTRMLELIRRERVSVLVTVPRVLGILRDHLLRRFPELAKRLEGGSELAMMKRWWRFREVHRAVGWKFWAVISGGASLPGETERFWNELGFALIQGYGMTETAALVTLNHPFRIGQGTIGEALPGREVRLSESGEILVRGDIVSRAIWQGGRMQRREGEWLETGDLAEKIDSGASRGAFRFLGRKGEAIVTPGGLNVHPTDIESAMLRQPGVRGCAVVGCEVGGGMEPVCVVLFSGDEAALQRAVHGANRELAEYQQVRRVLRWPELELPYTSTGKLLRRRVREWACAALQGGTSGSGGQNDALLSLVSEVTGSGTAQGGDELRLSEDLYLDSLGRVQLASALEQHLGVEVGEEQIASLATLGQLRAAVQLNLGEDVGEREGRVEKYVYPRWPWWWPVRVLRRVFLEAVVRPLIGVLLGPRVMEEERIPDSPMLIIANHVTLLDGPLVLYALPGRIRGRVAAAMSGEMLLDLRAGRGQGSLLANLLAPVAYWLLTALFNVFPLPRLQGFRRSFAHAGEALDRGYSVLIFPEGRRSREEEMGAFRQGIGLLASEAGVPVLPVYLEGIRRLRAKGAGRLRPGGLEVRVGRAITLPEGTSPAEWTRRLESEVRELGR